MSIKDHTGKEWTLSDDIYEILDDSRTFLNLGIEGYQKGGRVRLINCDHFDGDYVVVCRVNAEVAEFCGVKKTSLKKL